LDELTTRRDARRIPIVVDRIEYEVIAVTPNAGQMRSSQQSFIDFASGHGSLVRNHDGMDQFVFSCPTTDLLVQYWLNDDEKEGRPENRYEPISCPACVRLHFLNRNSGKLLGYEGE
jgi:hypothetical protein